MKERFIPSVIYRHFKGGLYASLFASNAIEADDLIDLANENFFMTATHTETGKTIVIFKDDMGAAMHSDSDCKEDLVIYTSLSNGTTYARPLHMFSEKVDRVKYPLEKYPEYSQEYRFEPVEYSITDSVKSNRENVLLSDKNTTVIFGDGKVGIFNGVCGSDDDDKFPLVVLNELDKARKVGEATKFSECEKDEIRLAGLKGQDVNLVFKNEASIDVLIEALNEAKLAFANK